MSGTVATRLTFADLERLPESSRRQELLHGELIELPPPKQKHNDVAHEIFHVLVEVVSAAHASGIAGHLGKVYLGTGYRMEDEGWLIPDVSITHPGQKLEDYYLGSPALAVEVISNEKTSDFIGQKIEEYLKNGALEVWVVYPSRGEIRVYRPDGTWRSYTRLFESELLAGATIDLGKILVP